MSRALSFILRRPWLAIAVAIALCTPALSVGFVIDDHLQRLRQRDPTGLEAWAPRPFDLFVFADGDPQTSRALMNEGLFPWWTDPEAKLAFWRPLTSLTHAVDHALWPERPAPMLLHNLVWLALALAAVGFLYFRILGSTPLAALALWLFAIDDAHGSAVGWIANRNALLTVALGALTIGLHDRWRRDGWRAGGWLAPAALALGLAAGEAALSAVAFLVAYAVHLDRGAWRRRVATLMPYLVVVVAWRVAYSALGYGVRGSGIYIDPMTDPLRFVGAVFERLPHLLAAQILFPWSDGASAYSFVSQRFAFGMWAVAVTVCGLFALAVRGLWRTNATSRFFVTGGLLAALPICAAFTADRLLWFVGIGGMGIVAQLLSRGVRGATGARRVVAWAGLALLICVHAVAAPLLLPLRARTMKTVADAIGRADATIPDDPGVSARTVVLLNPPGDAFAAYVTARRAADHRPRPARLRWLATGASEVTVERLDARTLRVTQNRGFYFRLTERMLRSPSRPFLVGELVALDGLTIEIESLTADGRPARVRATFDGALDGDNVVVLRWDLCGYVPQHMPAVGTTVRLAPVRLLAAVLGGHCRPDGSVVRRMEP